jgi:hypothetical protein
MPVDEAVDNWWTTWLVLGVTGPILWMIRAISKNLEKRTRWLLRSSPGDVKNLSRHQRRRPGPEGYLRVSEHEVAGVRESECPGLRVRGRVCSTGGPSWKGAFSGGGHRVDRGSSRLRRPMVACSAASRAERSDRRRRWAQRPLPSHTWKGPLSYAASSRGPSPPSRIDTPSQSGPLRCSSDRPSQARSRAIVRSPRDSWLVNGSRAKRRRPAYP